MCPLYDYKCDECDTIVEDVFKKVTSDPDITCPTCGAKVTTRAALVGKSTFKLEGNGWAKDNYSSQKAAKYSWQD